LQRWNRGQALCAFQRGQAPVRHRFSRNTASTSPRMAKLIRRSIICVVAIFSGASLFLPAQRLHYAQRPNVEDGEKVYKGVCIACHGAEGKGAPMASTVFLRTDTFPDFTDCAGRRLSRMVTGRRRSCMAGRRAGSRRSCRRSGIY
jgi:hypothetical protein